MRHDDDVRDLVDKTVKRFGRLDIAVGSNAGTEGKAGSVTEQTAESYAATFDTNVFGVLLSMKHELHVMLPLGSGSIVNVSSAYGSVGAPGATGTGMLSRYSVTDENKAALVSTVPVKRTATPDEIANAMVYCRYHKGLLHDRCHHRGGWRNVGRLNAASCPIRLRS